MKGLESKTQEAFSLKARVEELSIENERSNRSFDKRLDCALKEKEDLLKMIQNLKEELSSNYSFRLKVNKIPENRQTGHFRGFSNDKRPEEPGLKEDNSEFGRKSRGFS